MAVHRPAPAAQDSGQRYDLKPLQPGFGDLAFAAWATVVAAAVARLLTARVEPSEGGPHRKYYALSAQGQAYLADGRQQWKTTSSAIDQLISPA